MKLYLGNKNYSSWSVRAWLAMRASGLPYDEEVIPLGQKDTELAIRKVAPSGRVPVLIDGDRLIWDSLAICEYLAERVPSLWPADAGARAAARSVCAEMHAGFLPLMQELLKAARAEPWSEPHYDL